jgi:hypothetical protein
MIRSLLASCILFTLFAYGCSSDSGRPELVPVQGSVTFKGAPVEGATVTFFSEKSPRPASGVTDATGKFKLTSYDTNDGAVAGEHTVAISKASAASQAPAMTKENMKEKMANDIKMMSGGKMSDIKPQLDLPAKYADAKTSGEKRTVVKGDLNDFKFELTE